VILVGVRESRLDERRHVLDELGGEAVLEHRVYRQRIRRAPDFGKLISSQVGFEAEWKPLVVTG